MDPMLRNESSGPIVIKDIRLAGDGVGSVVKVVKVEIAPGSDDPSQYTSGGIFYSYPPAQQMESGECAVQRLFPVDGYVLPPATGGIPALAHVMILMEAVAPGSFHVTSDVVTYQQGASERQAALGYGLRGAVAPAGLGISPHGSGSPGSCGPLSRPLN